MRDWGEAWWVLYSINSSSKIASRHTLIRLLSMFLKSEGISDQKSSGKINPMATAQFVNISDCKVALKKPILKEKTGCNIILQGMLAVSRWCLDYLAERVRRNLQSGRKNDDLISGIDRLQRSAEEASVSLSSGMSPGLQSVYSRYETMSKELGVNICSIWRVNRSSERHQVKHGDRKIKAVTSSRKSVFMFVCSFLNINWWVQRVVRSYWRVWEVNTRKSYPSEPSDSPPFTCSNRQPEVCVWSLFFETLLLSNKKKDSNGLWKVKALCWEEINDHEKKR